MKEANPNLKAEAVYLKVAKPNKKKIIPQITQNDKIKKNKKKKKQKLLAPLTRDGIPTKEDLSISLCHVTIYISTCMKINV